MKDGIPDSIDIDEEKAGAALLAAGWRQGSALRLPAGIACPASFDFDSQTEWLVVCTQSCSVVSVRFQADPFIEVAVAKPVMRYRPTAGEATGKNIRKFHMPVEDGAGFGALECDINRRFFIPRARFLSITPGAQATIAGARSLGGWLARYYSRVALPNELVNRAKAGLFPIVKAALDAPYHGRTMAGSVSGFYLHWAPDAELGAEQPYQLALLILCEDIPSMNDFELAVGEKLETFAVPEGRDGIVLTWSVADRNSTTLGTLDGYSRLTEWDYLSGLGAVAGE